MDDIGNFFCANEGLVVRDRLNGFKIGSKASDDSRIPR
jgi:hypothetical protein